MNESFSAILQEWYDKNGRHDLPWRQTSDPYFIWISEIILQQTRVTQGLGYYQHFIRRFPTVESLASAPEDEVLSLWQGLGYYSRARNLHTAAKSIVALGHFPATYNEVRELKGVGDYTAAAICSFAYHAPHAVVDGNVYRVLSRFFGVSTPIDTTKGKKEFSILANELLDKTNPHLHNSAIMDFGALQCTPSGPHCGKCPLLGGCYAFQENKIEKFPVKSKAKGLTDRHLVYIYIKLPNNHILLHKRHPGDIWAGLYEPLLFEFPTPPTDNQILEKLSAIPDLLVSTLRLAAKGVRHNLTHRRLWIDFWIAESSHNVNLPGFIEISESLRDTKAAPQIIKKIYSSLETSTP